MTTPATGNSGAGTGDGGGGQPPPEPKTTFTQEEVNAIAGRARLEERQKYGDYEALKTRAAKADELEQAQMTTQERLEAKLAEEQRRNVDAEGRIASAMIQSEIRVRATMKGIIDPDAAVVLLDRTGVSYADDAGVVGVDTALDTLLAAKPYLKGQSIPPNLNSGGTPAAKPVILTAEQREAAALLGIPEDAYAKRLPPTG